jgi:hypothetical protein
MQIGEGKMPWPKGRPRKKIPTADPSFPKESAKQQASSDRPRRWKMRAGDWDSGDFQSYVDVPDRRDKFFIAEDERPEGMDIAWITHSVIGQEMTQFRSGAIERGWRPVYGQDFDGLYDGRWLPKGAPGEITVDGMTLMARPIQISRLARERERRMAEDVIRTKEQSWKGGSAMRASGADHASARGYNRIAKSYERINIPTDGRDGD